VTTPTTAAGLAGIGASPGPVAVASILADLDAGRRRAAVPDPQAPGGWRADPEVKAAILACFRDRATEAWDLGGVLRFRDRVGLPPKELLYGPEADAAADAGRAWRIVPGGTSVRAGVYLGPGVVVMPPSFVNVGAWIGEDTMVDSHVLVGSCAQIGARVHLSAGVSIGGVLEPAGARPVIVEDGAFVGAGSSLLEGVLVGSGAVIGAGVILTGTSRLYDLVRDRVLVGTAEAPLVVPPGAVVVPGSRAVWGSFAVTHGLSMSVALLVKDRDAGTDARVVLEEALR
jgi:2,3,4,5-tetrahydropyridine-2-carboxylate N-succinyltransferase